MKTKLIILLLLISTVTFGQVKYTNRTKIYVRKSTTTLAKPTTANFSYANTWCWNTTDSIIYTKYYSTISAKYKMYPYNANPTSTYALQGIFQQSYSNSVYPFYIYTSNIHNNIPTNSNFTDPNVWCWNTTDNKIYTKVNGVITAIYSIYNYSATVNPIPGTPGTIAGTSSQCPRITGQVYSITAVQYATSYTWTVPIGWTINSGQGTIAIVVTTGLTAQNGNITVTASNTIGTSGASAKAVTVIAATPSAPISTSGSGATCTQITANWNASTNATSYKLDVSTVNTFITYVRQNVTVTGLTYNVTGLAAGTTYYYRTRSLNTCGTSGYSNTITYSTLPATPSTPGAISGLTIQGTSLTGQIYSISPVTNSTSYTWTVPTGWSITSGNTTNSITVTTGTAGQNGNITVSAINSCGTSSIKTLGVVIISTSTSTADWWVSSSPNASDLNSGDSLHPFRTLNKAWTVVSAGDLVYLRGGTYYMPTYQVLTGKNGTQGNMIKIWAYPGETPIITRSVDYPDDDNSYGEGIRFTGNFVHFKGIEVTGFYQTVQGWSGIGFFAVNCRDNIFELIHSHHNGGGGISLGYEPWNPLGTVNVTRNIFLNCDSDHNQDPYTSALPGTHYNYDNADGFSSNLEIAYCSDTLVNTRIGCRAWCNSDDGYDDLRNNGIFYNIDCWAFWNGFILPKTGLGYAGITESIQPLSNSGEHSRGEGFKFGGAMDIDNGAIKRYYIRDLAFGNTDNGFATNNATFQWKMVNCTSVDNGFTLDTYPLPYGRYLTGYRVASTENNTINPQYCANSIAYSNGVPSQYPTGDGTLRRSWFDTNTTLITNTFIKDGSNTWVKDNPAITVTSADFTDLTNISQLYGARQADGSLPIITFLHLANGSDLIGSGTNVGYGTDLGCFQH